MADFQPICPKCGKAMERGHVPDVTHGQVLQSRWSRGDPEPRRFHGGIKWEADEQIPLAAYRCPACGYVEFYARPA
jgi:ribosomal protein S27AE